jgi:hypothetical protein
VRTNPKLNMNNPTPEKATVYRVAYNKDGEFTGFDYHASREAAQAHADHEQKEGTKTRIDEIEVEVSLKGIVDVLNDYAIAWDPDGFDQWYPEDHNRKIV